MGEGSGERAYSQLKIEASQVKATIFDYPEFAAFNRSVCAQFGVWLEWARPLLKAIEPGNRPKVLAEMLGEELLKIFAPVPLIDPYDVYQHLMDYWAETMQDDVWIIASDGWEAAKVIRQIVPIKDKNDKLVYREAHDFLFDKKRYKTDIISPALMVARYFAAEQAAIGQMQAEAETLAQQLEEMREEHGGEDGLLAEVIEDGKIAKGALKDRLQAIKADKSADDERKALQAYSAHRSPHAMPSCLRPRSRRWWWTTNGSPRSPPACRANWIASARRSPGASDNWPSVTKRRFPCWKTT